MEIQQFTRKPFEVDAVQVSPTNYEAVAAWCKGEATLTGYKLMGDVYEMGAVLLPKQGPKNNKVYTVLIGQWITRHRGSFRSWGKEDFEKGFVQVLQPGDPVRSIGTEEFEYPGWEGVVKDVNMVGVDFGARGSVLFQRSLLEKISSVSSEQGVLNNQINGMALESFDIIEQMRNNNREAIEALEKKNLESEINPEDQVEDDEIRIGDLVKIKKSPNVIEEYVGQYGHVHAFQNGLVEVEFATADPDKPEITPFLLGNLEKLRQDGEALNLAEDRLCKGDRVQVIFEDEHAKESSCDFLGKFGTALGEQVEGKELVMIDGKDSPWSFRIDHLHRQDEAVITVAEARRQLGMEPTGVVAVDETVLSPEAKAQFEEMVKANQEEILMPAFAEMALEDHPLLEKVKFFEGGEIVTVDLKGSRWHGIRGIVISEDDDHKIGVQFGMQVDYFGPDDLRKVLSVDDFAQDDKVRVNKPKHDKHDWIGKVTVVGTGDSANEIEVLFLAGADDAEDNSYGLFKPSELIKL